MKLYTYLKFINFNYSIMKSLQQFISEHLDKLVLTTAQKIKEKPVDENSREEETVGENQEVSDENGNQETEKVNLLIIKI